eukprot:g976.t1
MSFNTSDRNFSSTKTTSSSFSDDERLQRLQERVKSLDITSFEKKPKNSLGTFIRNRWFTGGKVSTLVKKERRLFERYEKKVERRLNFLQTFALQDFESDSLKHSATGLEIKLGTLPIDSKSVLFTMCLIQFSIALNALHVIRSEEFLLITPSFSTEKMSKDLAELILDSVQRNGVSRRMSCSLDRSETQGNVFGESRKASSVGLTESKKSIKSTVIAELLQSEEIKDSIEEMESWICDEEAVDINHTNLLGSGTYGDVYECNLDGQNCAVKILRHPITLVNAKQFITECQQMADLQHPNLLRMMRCCFTENVFFLVTEIAKNGTLQSCILSDRMNLTLNNQIINMLIGTLSGIHFLHSRANPILHRDIKPDNILVRENFTTVLSDFGEAKKLVEENKLSTLVGTPMFVAPEIIREEESTTKSDIFSFAMVTLVCATFYHQRMRLTREFCKLKGIRTIDSFPYDWDPIQLCYSYKSKVKMVGISAMKEISRGWRPKLPDPFVRTWPKLAKLIEDCWNDDIDARPNAKEALKRMRSIKDEAKGTEDDYLGIETYPLRKWLLSQTERTFFDVFHTNVRKKDICAGLAQVEVTSEFSAIDYFSTENLSHNKYRQKCRRILDGWVSMEFVEIKLPWPLSNRVGKNVSLSMMLDDTYHLFYSCPLTLCGEWPELDAYGAPEGWIEPASAVPVDSELLTIYGPSIPYFNFMNLRKEEEDDESGDDTTSVPSLRANSLTSSSRMKRDASKNHFTMYREVNLGGYIPKSRTLLEKLSTKGLRHRIHQVQNLAAMKSSGDEMRSIKASETRILWDSDPSHRARHHTEYLLPFWPPNLKAYSGSIPRDVKKKE